jgi:hypothetical protein
MKLALGFGSLALALVAWASGCDDTVDATALAGDAGAGSDATAPTADACTDATADGGVCAPRAVTGFAPVWTPPTALHQNQCSSEQIETLVDCVYDRPGHDQAACDAFFAAPANASCVACGYTKTTAAALGPILSNDTSVQVNYAGCVARLEGDITANGCGAKLQASQLCLDEACVAACPVPDNDDGTAFAAFLKCNDDAAKTVCKTFFDPTTCATPLTTDGGVASACLPNTQDFGERAADYVTLFCGAPALSDAGSDG